MDMEWLKGSLAPDFVHISPFGRLEGRDAYLRTVVPMARKSVQELTIKHVIASGNQAAVWFENRTPEGVIPSCDWVRVEDGLIKEIQSVYDSAKVHEILSSDEQDLHFALLSAVYDGFMSRAFCELADHGRG